MKQLFKRLLSVIAAAVMLTTVFVAVPDMGTTVETEAASSWNGTNYGGGSAAGYRTFLEAYGIDYNVYQKWMDDHDHDSANKDYYLGTPYVGYDHRNPHGDRFNTYGSLDRYGVEGMNCTGFVWHVQYKAAVLSGASRAQINSIPVMGNVTPTWNRLGIYRIYFRTKEEMMKSGVLEKGDIFWIYGSGDNHHCIFYGNNSSHDRYWHSSGKNNNMTTIHAAGNWLGCWVAKCTQPNKIELQVNPTTTNNGGQFGAKYCVFTDKAKAQAALDNPTAEGVWDSRTGTIVLDKNGRGCLRTDNAPADSELWKNGTAQVNHSYFNSIGKKVDAKSTYYAVQYSAPEGMEKDTVIHEFKDSKKRTSTGYRIFSFKLPKTVSTPEISKTKSTGDGVRLSWNAVSGADKYRVYKKSESGWTRLGETASTSFIDKTAENGSIYTYTIRCVDNDGDFISDFNHTGWKHQHSILPTPQFSVINDTSNGVLLQWNPVEGAAKYRAYLKMSNGWTKLIETDQTSFVQTGVKMGAKYTYTLRCLDSEGDFISDFNHDGWVHTYTGTPTPQITSINSEASGIRLTWQADAGADQYALYHKSAKGWTRIATLTGTEYLDENVSIGTSYIYTLRCLNSKGEFVSNFNRDGWKATYSGVSTPAYTSITDEPEGVRLSWAPIDGVASYRLYYKQGNDWKRFAEVNGTEYLFPDIEFNKTLTFTIRCANAKGNFISYHNKTGWTHTYAGVTTPEISTTENTDGGVKLSFTPIEGAAKYRVYRKNDKGQWGRIGETEVPEYLDPNVQSGKTYTYTVRCLNSTGKLISDYVHAGSTVKYVKP